MKRSNNIFIFIFEIILGVLTVASALSLVFALLAGSTDPNSTTFFNFFALAAPVIYCVCIFCLAFWIIRWRLILALIVALPLLIGFPAFGNFVQLEFSEYYPHKKKNKQELKILTYNVHQMRPYGDEENSFQGLFDTLKAIDADVICIQEFRIQDSAHLKIAESLLDDYAYRAHQHDASKSLHNHRGLLIASKYPLANRKSVTYNVSENGFIHSDVVFQGDTLRLFNCHLQTTGVNKVSKEKGMMEIIEGNTTKKDGAKMYESLKENFVKRAVQADSVATLISQTNRDVIVVGDFNSPPMTYTYNTVSRTLSDAFRDAGNGYGSTFKGMRGLFRLDYVLYSDDNYDCLNYEAQDFPYSDHKAVIVTLKSNKE